MSQYVVRPTSIHSQGGLTTPSTPATVLANLGDNSDSTVVTNNSVGPIMWGFGLAAPSITAGEFVARVGWSMRWKGNTNGTYSIGSQIYTTSGVPGNYASLTPNNSSAFTTTQVAYQAKEWTLSEVAGLRLAWYDGKPNGSAFTVEHADIWATVYTIANATATPANRTETASVFPTISVDATATIDWESTTLDWQNLRRVTVEVRIESGGTTAGTGTLVSTNSASTIFTATGTRTITVNMPDALPNGTYKVYARAIRYREDGVTRADQTSTWSTAATLTMSAPSPVTPTVSVTTNQTEDSNTISVTPVASTGYSNPYIYVERSDDGGITWAPVRNATGVPGSYGIASLLTDYEAPRGQVAYYRAKVEASYGGFVNASLYADTAATLIVVDGWNLKSVSTPTANMAGVQVVGRPKNQVQEDLAVFRPLGRQYPVVVSGTISGEDGSLDIICSSATEWTKLMTLVRSQSVLFLESAFGEAKYIRLLSPTSSDLGGTITTPVRNVAITYVEVDKPTVVVGQTEVSYDIPTEVDGGNASSTFTAFYDGGQANSTMAPVFDGGTA